MDVGGKATNQWKQYYRNVNAVIFVVDASDRDNILKAKSLLS